MAAYALRATVAFELAHGGAPGGGPGGYGHAGDEAATGGTYCFDVAATHEAFAVSASNGAIKVYAHGPRGVALAQRLEGHQGRINDLAFDRGNPGILWTAAADGTVRAWDLRSGRAAHVFLGTAAPPHGPPTQAAVGGAGPNSFGSGPGDATRQIPSGAGRSCCRSASMQTARR